MTGALPDEAHLDTWRWRARQ